MTKWWRSPMLWTMAGVAALTIMAGRGAGIWGFALGGAVLVMMAVHFDR